MKTLFAILLATLCAATSYGQTLKALSYNTTNGQVVAATNVVWTNAFSFSTNTVAAQVRTNLSLGSTWLTNTNVTNFRTAIGLGLTNNVQFAYVESQYFFVGDGSNGIDFETDPVAAITRTNLGLGLPALTNTSNVTTMRALAGSTNTNHPFTGSFTVVDDVNDIATVVVSNGIIVELQFP